MGFLIHPRIVSPEVSYLLAPAAGPATGSKPGKVPPVPYPGPLPERIPPIPKGTPLPPIADILRLMGMLYR